MALLFAADEEKDVKTKKVNRCVVTLTFVAKVILALTDCYWNCFTRDFDVLLVFLRQLMPQGRTSIFTGLSNMRQQAMADKLNRDVFTPTFLHHMTTR